MPDYRFDRPVFIIGAARSGTTLLGELLSKHPDVAYWLEPKYIWRYAKARSLNDIRTVEEATPATVNYIRKKFHRFLARQKKKRFIEKTPSNVFRISFINTVFPEALFLYIERDGQDVCLSAEKKWTSRPDSSALYRRLISFEIPLRDLPFYTVDFLRDVFGRFFAPERGYIWGPQFDGIREYRDEHSVIETCARQWLESVKSAHEALQYIPESRVYRLNYEELVDNTEECLKGVYGFLGLESTYISDAILEKVNKRRKEYTLEEREKINEILAIISGNKWN